MSKRKTPKAPTTTTTAAAAPLRRSPRLLCQKPNDPHPSFHSPNPTTKPQHQQKEPSTKSATSIAKRSQRSKLLGVYDNGSRRSPRLSGGADKDRCFRRSPRLALLEKAKEPIMNDVAKKELVKKVSSTSEKRNEIVSSIVEERVEVSERKCLELVVAFKGAEGGVVCKENEEKTRVTKRKRPDEKVSECNDKNCDKRKNVESWTKEQEIALERAYFLAKPTPDFWKDVAKMVPGKSAQECFDKVQSDHITPPQAPPRSRASRMKSSPIAHFSASKLLGPGNQKMKWFTFNKRKDHLSQRTIRFLMQKHNMIYKDEEADLFSILEPSVNPSNDNLQDTMLPSTPMHLREKQGLLRNYDQKPSGRQKILSRFSNSQGIDLASPPVLKPVKNRVLHEKYINQLRSREAKRKASNARAVKSGKQNQRNIHVTEMDVTGAAKNALISDAMDAITKFQQAQANTEYDSSDDDHFDNSDDDETENGL